MEIPNHILVKIESTLKAVLNDTVNTAVKNEALDAIVFIRGGTKQVPEVNDIDRAFNRLNQEQRNEIQHLISEKMKIKAIKLIRQFTGLPLKDAMAMAEASYYFNRPS